MISSTIGIDKLDDSDRRINNPAPWNPKDIEKSKDLAKRFVRKVGLA